MKSKPSSTVALFFVASPLHYLAALSVARNFESGSHCIVIPYHPNIRNFVNASDWDAVAYAPWPRFAPLPGVFGRHKRLLSNLRDVAMVVGHCHTLHIHSPVFDTEAINYFLKGLPRLCNAKVVRARIIPDGLLNITRHPLSRLKLIGQNFRRLRRLVSPELDYSHFTGDRIGSEAPFVDRIYSLAGFPHEYPTNKVVPLPPLVEKQSRVVEAMTTDAALIVGQPLVGIGALTPADLDVVLLNMISWLRSQDIKRVIYKAHPRDPNHEYRPPGSELLEIKEPLEIHMAKNTYRVVIGCFSTSLYLARQIYGQDVPVISFGTDKVRFKNPDQRSKAVQLMDRLGIQRL